MDPLINSQLLYQLSYAAMYVRSMVLKRDVYTTSIIGFCQRVVEVQFRLFLGLINVGRKMQLLRRSVGKRLCFWK